MEEIWKDIKGYEGYYKVSNFGKIKSIARIIKGRWGNTLIKDKEMTLCKNKGGYLTSILSVNKTKKSVYTHVLVAEAFLTKPESDLRIIGDHKNGIKTDNRVENLQWLSYRDNFLKGKGVNHKKQLGVFKCYHPNYEYYVARIHINGKLIRLGYHKTNIEYLGKLYENALQYLHLYNGCRSEFIKLIKSDVTI